MASKTALTTLRREIRQKNAGRKARNARENRGSTPPFPVHPVDADANDAAKKAEK